MKSILALILAVALFALCAQAETHVPAAPGWLINPQPQFPAQVDSGGPDAYGYTWKQTADPGGPAFAFKNITSIGTLVTGIGDDNYVGPFPIGFPFHYYWYDVTQYWIGSNGYIEFGPPFNSASPFPNSIPLATPPNNFLGVYMADFDMTIAGATCHRWNNADSCIIQWTNVPYWGTTPIGSHTFEIILSRLDSNITYEYGLQTGISRNVSFLVGIENYSGMMGLAHSVNVYPPSNNAIKW
jgi:large repetitive protein